MVKKILNQKKQKENPITKKRINLSSIYNKTKQKIIQKKNNNIGKLNTTVIFKINSNSLALEEFEKEYHKRCLFYLKEEFNSKLITMFFNYLSLSKILPSSFKNNRYFIKEFLKIIIDLLINEIDLVTMTLIFDNIGWIKDGDDPWTYIYYICLSAKQKSSSENSLTVLLKILDKNNSGFSASYYEWINNSNNLKKLEQIGIKKANERFRELMIPQHINENNKKFINYNDIVNKIVSMSKQKENISQQNNQLNYINMSNFSNKNLVQNNIFSQPKASMQMPPLDMGPYQSGLNNNNRLDNPVKNLQQPMLDLQPSNSYYNDKLFDLSCKSSRNNSFFGFDRSFDGELNRAPSYRYNNK